MNTFTKISLSAALVLTAALAIGANSAEAACPNVVITPHHDHFHGSLPKFGFSSRTIQGLGEEVVRVRHHSIAEELGLEPGDLILDLNEFRLTRRGDWHEALHDAMDHHDGCVELRIRDIRTGSIILREICLNGPIGPITPKSQTVNRYSIPSPGPVTTQSLGSQSGNLNSSSNQNIQLNSAPKSNFQDLSRLFKKN